MDKIWKFFAALFGKDMSADEIFAPINKIIQQAEIHIADQEDKAKSEAEEAAKLQAKIDARKAEVEKTRKRATNVKKLMELAD